jgi:hypothetical protein
MKNIIKTKTKLLIALSVATILVSCEYQTYQDAPYPDQLIYMPAAVFNNYLIDAVPAHVGVVPTPGYTYRFSVDTAARKFNIPLGVYRSGINNDGAFNVDIAINTDTITKLLAIPGKLPVGTILLPSDKYSIPASVVMKDGGELAKFELAVDLDLLLGAYPAGKYAIAVTISSSARKSNPKLATTIIVIDTKIMKPAASFTTSVPTASDPRTLKYTSTSLYGTKFIWNFGDGSERVIRTNEFNEDVLHTYAAAGSYTVTLTVQGVADWVGRSVSTAVKVIP